MKLTQSIRKEFVDAVMLDIKTGVDNEKIHASCMTEALAELPPEAIAMWNNKELRPYLSVKGVSFDSYRQTNEKVPEKYIYAKHFTVPGIGYKLDVSDSLKANVRNMLKEEAERLEEKWSMGNRLTAMAATCKTHAALTIMFPDLAQYIPEVESASPSYPVPAVVMESFMGDLKKLGVPGKRAAVAV